MENRRDKGRKFSHLRLIRRYPIVLAGTVLLAVILLLAVAGPWLYPYNPWEYAGKPLEPPSFAHPLRTNDVG